MIGGKAREHWLVALVTVVVLTQSAVSVEIWMRHYLIGQAYWLVRTLSATETYVRFLVSLWTLVRVLLTVVGPVLVLVVNAYVFRLELLDLCSEWLKDRGVKFQRPSVLELKRKKEGVDFEMSGGTDLALLKEKGDAASVIKLDKVLAKAKFTETADGRRGMEIVVEVYDLDVNYVAHDPRFKDTNVTRLFAKINGEDNAEKQSEEIPIEDVDPETAKHEDKKQQQVSRFQVVVILKKATIRIKAAHGTKVVPIGMPVVLENERIDPKVFASRFHAVAWIQGFVVRMIAGSSLDMVVGAFSAAGHGTEYLADTVFKSVEFFTDKIPGGKFVSGVTHGVRDVLGGAVGAGNKLLGGVAQGGRHVVAGVTSGSPADCATGLKLAGQDIGHGVVDSVTSVAGGIKKGGESTVTGIKNVGESTVSGAKAAGRGIANALSSCGGACVGGTTKKQQELAEQRESSPPPGPPEATAVENNSDESEGTTPQAK